MRSESERLLIEDGKERGSLSLTTRYVVLIISSTLIIYLSLHPPLSLSPLSLPSLPFPSLLLLSLSLSFILFLTSNMFKQ